MKKTFKKLISIFAIVLMNINSFAAVSGNDASAFVTKTEFDAIVDNFSEHMDNYERTLVAKVDSSIANYLAGLSNQKTVTLDNYAKAYATAMGVSQIEPIRELITDGDYGYYYKSLCMANWYYIVPQMGGNNSISSASYKHTGVWFYDDDTKAKLSETTENRLKRVFVLTDTSGRINGCIRNIQTTLSTCNLLGAGPSAGCNISYWAATVNSTATKGLDDLTSMYNFNAQYNYYYSSGSWTSQSATNFNSYINTGAYNYSSTTDNAITSQICRYTGTTIYGISATNYSKKMIQPVSSGRYFYYYGEDGRTTCVSPSSRPYSYYGKPVYSSYTNIATLYTAGSKVSDINAPIYAGVPLCKTDEEGEVTFTINIVSAAAGNIYISNNDTGFDNSLTPTSEVMFSVDNKEKANKWTTTTADSGKHTIKFKGDVKKTYWIKYIPNANGPKYTIGDTITQFIEG